ncbi:hypothetical protein QFZ73_005972 [Peribacillus sp. V2I11]|nr:hypothetical protein [Peribacillus sp. V2I11]
MWVISSYALIRKMTQSRSMGMMQNPLQHGNILRDLVKPIAKSFSNWRPSYGANAPVSSIIWGWTPS